MTLTKSMFSPLPHGFLPSAVMPDKTATVKHVKKPLDTSNAYRILFIGNSFTYYNSMPSAIFSRIAHNAGYNVTVEAITKGGHYLREFADENDIYGHRVREKLKSATRYDIVVAQDQSSSPLSNPAQFYDAARELHELVTKNGADMWLYETWGYKAGHPGLAEFGDKTDIMEMKLRAAYYAIGEELGVNVAYVGAAMTEIYRKGGIELYNADKKHPSEAGSHLIAWTLFCSIFGVDVRSLSLDGTMTAEDAEIMKKAAYDVSFLPPTLENMYKTVSLGVTAANK